MLKQRYIDFSVKCHEVHCKLEIVPKVKLPVNKRLSHSLFEHIDRSVTWYNCLAQFVNCFNQLFIATELANRLLSMLCPLFNSVCEPLSQYIELSVQLLVLGIAFMQLPRQNWLVCWECLVKVPFILTLISLKNWLNLRMGISIGKYSICSVD